MRGKNEISYETFLFYLRLYVYEENDVTRSKQPHLEQVPSQSDRTKVNTEPVYDSSCSTER